MSTGRKNELTEWDELQIKMGNMERPIIERPPTDAEYDADALAAKEELEEQSREKLSTATLDELDELEDEEDEKILQEYRNKRIAEMKAKALSEKFGSLITISEPEYKTEVTDAKGMHVVVFLTKPGLPGCDTMESILSELAKTNRATKFVKIRSEDAIRGYPDKNLPTVIVYHNSDVKRQFIGLGSFAGQATSLKGAVETDMEEDPRKRSGVTRVNRRFTEDSDSD